MRWPCCSTRIGSSTGGRRTPRARDWLRSRLRVGESVVLVAAARMRWVSSSSTRCSPRCARPDLDPQRPVRRSGGTPRRGGARAAGGRGRVRPTRTAPPACRWKPAATMPRRARAVPRRRLARGRDSGTRCRSRSSTTDAARAGPAYTRPMTAARLPRPLALRADRLGHPHARQRHLRRLPLRRPRRRWPRAARARHRPRRQITRCERWSRAGSPTTRSTASCHWRHRLHRARLHPGPAAAAGQTDARLRRDVPGAQLRRIGSSTLPVPAFAGMANATFLFALPVRPPPAGPPGSGSSAPSWTPAPSPATSPTCAPRLKE